jgi:hypothetical protein
MQNSTLNTAYNSSSVDTLKRSGTSYTPGAVVKGFYTKPRHPPRRYTDNTQNFKGPRQNSTAKGPTMTYLLLHTNKTCSDAMLKDKTQTGRVQTTTLCAEDAAATPPMHTSNIMQSATLKKRCQQYKSTKTTTAANQSAATLRSANNKEAAHNGLTADTTTQPPACPALQAAAWHKNISVICLFLVRRQPLEL